MNRSKSGHNDIATVTRDFWFKFLDIKKLLIVAIENKNMIDQQR